MEWGIPREKRIVTTVDTGSGAAPQRGKGAEPPEAGLCLKIFTLGVYVRSKNLRSPLKMVHLNIILVLLIVRLCWHHLKGPQSSPSIKFTHFRGKIM